MNEVPDSETPASDAAYTSTVRIAAPHAPKRLSPWELAQILASHYSRYGRLMRLHRPIGI